MNESLRALSVSAPTGPDARRSCQVNVRYHAATAAGLVVSTVGFFLLTAAGAPLLGAGLGGIVAGAATNYLGCDRLVFRQARRWTPLPSLDAEAGLGPPPAADRVNP